MGQAQVCTEHMARRLGEQHESSPSARDCAAHDLRTICSFWKRKGAQESHRVLGSGSLPSWLQAVSLELWFTASFLLPKLWSRKLTLWEHGLPVSQNSCSFSCLNPHPGDTAAPRPRSWDHREMYRLTQLNFFHPDWQDKDRREEERNLKKLSRCWHSKLVDR